MSIQARQSLVASGHLVFQDGTQKGDLLNPNTTQTELIAALIYLTIHCGHYIEITAVRSDHHDDGPHGHAGGYAADCWPLDSAAAGDYMDATAEGFADFLEDAAKMPFYYQIGLAGEANTAANLAAAGPGAFVDMGADHVHLGTI